ncbi:MAG TPA: TlpA disulfide reductase family protein [Polyangiaceae bacterium]|nr:TlpA disulfide reductase family protein [Polyangiaceae bacterium]
MTPVAEPAKAPVAPRAPLCQADLEQKPQSFKPKRAPNQISIDPGEGLPADPLKPSASKSERGHWTWINFWAAWCVPCREELPLLFSWRDQLGAKLSFEFVSIDDDERQLREFLGRQPAHGLRQSYWLPDGAVRQAWLEALNLDKEPELPLQLLIDPKGQLRCRVQGAVEARDLAALEHIVLEH